MSSNKSNGLNWCREATTLLIQLYEGFPCLYSPICPQYHNRNIRLQALTDIMNEFNRQKLANVTLGEIKKTAWYSCLIFNEKLKKSEVSGTSSCNTLSQCEDENIEEHVGQVIYDGDIDTISDLDVDLSSVSIEASQVPTRSQSISRHDSVLKKRK
ncbi:hypothetical protein RN001_005647 [Aquatica leii]|uniref:MADF domain-containing protein n=1 Tax=Aquatica leii TaxID=1421715 RepID=A0AAN7SPX3_9COLE|nr:hypothetical protein RN001_005647 [Aquatica leii]